MSENIDGDATERFSELRCWKISGYRTFKKWIVAMRYVTTWEYRDVERCGQNNAEIWSSKQKNENVLVLITCFSILIMALSSILNISQCGMTLSSILTTVQYVPIGDWLGPLSWLCHSFNWPIPLSWLCPRVVLTMKECWLTWSFIWIMSHCWLTYRYLPSILTMPKCWLNCYFAMSSCLCLSVDGPASLSYRFSVLTDLLL